MAAKKKCNFCDKEAIVSVVLIQNNTMKEVAYCEEHAKTYAVLSPCAYEIVDQVAGDEKPIATVVQTCPCCHYASEDLVKSSLMGCGECYTYFESVTRTILQRLYETPIHFGKVPTKYLTAESFVPRVDLLKQQLAALVASENFEQAALIKKKLQGVERQINALKKKESNDVSIDL